MLYRVLNTPQVPNISKFEICQVIQGSEQKAPL